MLAHPSVDDGAYPRAIHIQQSIRVAQVCDIALYLLIWGEAANLRHCPECLCFLFHQMRGELWRDVPASARPGGWFLAEVRSKLHEATRGCMNSCTGMHE